MEPSETSEREAKKGKKQVSATVSDGGLVADVLRIIFGRLISYADLARAALVCKQWRFVASSPAILRSFHSRGRPPLLGFLLSDHAVRDFLFVPAPSRSDPFLASATSSGDFLFDNIPSDPHDIEHVGDFYDCGGYRYRCDKWRLRGCDVGLVLLSRGRDSRRLAVYDPFARSAVFVGPPQNFPPGIVQYVLLAGDGDTSFKIIATRISSDGVEAAVFSSGNEGWAALPTTHHSMAKHDGMRAGRFAYWQSAINESVLVLDTSARAWSLLPVPVPLGESYCLVDMKEHGGLCLVGCRGVLSVGLWVPKEGGGDEPWVLEKEVSLLLEFKNLRKLHRKEQMRRVRVLAARDAFVYLEFWSMTRPCSWFLVLNLATNELETFYNNADDPYRGPGRAFFMAWAPPFLSPDEEKNQSTQVAEKNA